MKPIDPEKPALPALPIFDDEAKGKASSLEELLDDQMDRSEAMLRFLSGNLRVDPAEMREVGVMLKTMVDETAEQDPAYRLSFAYYAGVFDGVLLKVAQDEVDRGRKKQ